MTGTESSFDIDVFGRPKPNGIILDPHNYILKSSPRLRVRAIIARGEALAEQGRYYDAVQQYNQALDVQKNNSLALFRTGEAFFYQKNYSAAANAFRDALDGDLDPSDKWVEVWSHIYLGKIYDIAGDRTRAVNEYSKAEQTNDDTGGAQDEAQKYIAQALHRRRARPALRRRKRYHRIGFARRHRRTGSSAPSRRYESPTAAKAQRKTAKRRACVDSLVLDET